MATPYLGEIRLFAGATPPPGWLPCDGTLLPIPGYDMLFRLIGSDYGGDGRNTFAVPDLRGRVPLCYSYDKGGHSLAATGGEAQHTLKPNELGAHTHPLWATTAAGTSAIPTGCLLAASQVAPFYQPMDGNRAAMDAGQILPAGGGGAHDNMAPFVTLQFCISTTGDVP